MLPQARRREGDFFWLLDSLEGIAHFFHQDPRDVDGFDLTCFDLRLLCLSDFWTCLAGAKRYAFAT